MQTHDESNSYQPVSVSPRKVKAGPPLNWISGSIKLLRDNWGVILPAYLLVIVAPVLIQLVSFELMFRGSLFTMVLIVSAIAVLTLVLNAGMIAVFHSVAEGRPRFTSLFAAFGGHSIVHLVLMLLMMALVALAMALVGYWIVGTADLERALFGTGYYGDAMSFGLGTQNFMLRALFVFLSVVAAVTLFAALFCYVVPLIVIAREGVFAAISHSFRASFKNLFVLIFFAVNVMALSQLFFFPLFTISASTASMSFWVVAMILAAIVWGAVLTGAYYLSFRDVLLADEPPLGEPALDTAVAA